MEPSRRDSSGDVGERAYITNEDSLLDQPKTKKKSSESTWNFRSIFFRRKSTSTSHTTEVTSSILHPKPTSTSTPSLAKHKAKKAKDQEGKAAGTLEKIQLWVSQKLGKTFKILVPWLREHVKVYDELVQKETLQQQDTSKEMTEKIVDYRSGGTRKSSTSQQKTLELEGTRKSSATQQSTSLMQIPKEILTLKPKGAAKDHELMAKQSASKKYHTNIEDRHVHQVGTMHAVSYKLQIKTSQMQQTSAPIKPKEDSSIATSTQETQDVRMDKDSGTSQKPTLKNHGPFDHPSPSEENGDKTPAKGIPTKTADESNESPENRLEQEPAKSTATEKSELVDTTITHEEGVEEVVIERVRIDNSVTPTSFIKGSEDKLAKDHLKNIYTIRVEGTDYEIIRTGVIDTPEKRDELFDQLRSFQQEIAKKKPGFKLRVMSQQLNSFEFFTHEKPMIENQHKLLAELNAKMQEEGIGEIWHLNTPSNRVFHTTKKLGALGGLLPSEKSSKQQNVDSLYAYSKWMTEDDAAYTKNSKIEGRKATPITLTLPSYDKYRNEIQKCQKNIETVLVGMIGNTNPESEKELNKLRAEMKGYLLKDYKKLKELEEQLKDGITSDHPNARHNAKVYQQVTLLRQLLGSQLEVEGQSLDRGQEGMIIQLLNSHFGVTSQINCKSGLDRTGLWHAIKLGMEKRLKCDIEGQEAISDKDKAQNEKALFDLVSNWDANTKKINKKIQDKGGIEAFMAELDKPGTTPEEVQEKAQTREILKFREQVLQNLIEIGIPITFASTGVVGLKWSPGAISENLIPLNFLPSHIEVISNTIKIGDQAIDLTESDGSYKGTFEDIEFTCDKDGNISCDKDGNILSPTEAQEKLKTQGKVEKTATKKELVKYDSTGEVVGIAETGIQLLTRLSSLRGS